ncbi:MAG: alpha/beta hydrolase, partial [Halobacteria archaeon]|nr:alpha/beta hydrolase [Halobacteria archaeon]
MVVRETLKNAAGLIAFSLGAENLIHERMPEDFPRVTTRGHFDLDYEDQPFENPKATDFLPLSLIGEVKRTRLNPGHDELDYGTRGEIPGFTSGCDESPDEIVVFVHGWLADEKGSLGRFSLMRHSLRKAGYEGPVIGFSWDTDHRSYNWKLGIEVAARNGPKLAQFVHDYRRKNPDTDVRLIS